MLAGEVVEEGKYGDGFNKICVPTYCNRRIYNQLHTTIISRTTVADLKWMIIRVSSERHCDLLGNNLSDISATILYYPPKQP